MMNDLFSAFDPNNKLFSISLALNWMSAPLGLSFLPLNFWVKTNRLYQTSILVMKFVAQEFKVILKGKIYGSYHIFISIFILILMNNFLGMFPYIFTATSHLAFTLTFSLILWISFMSFGWLNFTNVMFSNLVPTGTPAPLMPFMVCIETISNMIRSGTLAVRLSANMISGHLLLTLMGNQGSSSSMFVCMTLIILQMVLLTLEFSVSIIQAYVFSILSALYSGETTSH